MRGLIFRFLFFLIFYFTSAKENTIGGQSPETWQSICKEHFRKYGPKAAKMGIHLPGFCERYICQKHGKDAYAVTTDECQNVQVTQPNCRLKKGDPKERYPFCCTRVVCDKGKGN